jgi:hypothetical protein
MKVVLDICAARKELEKIQKFYNENCYTYESRYLAKKITNKHNATIVVEDIKALIESLEKVQKIYLKNGLTKLYMETLLATTNFQEMIVLAECNGWTEISDLNFSKEDFEKNAGYILDYLQKLRKNATNANNLK